MIKMILSVLISLFILRSVVTYPMETLNEEGEIKNWDEEEQEDNKYVEDNTVMKRGWRFHLLDNDHLEYLSRNFGYGGSCKIEVRTIHQCGYTYYSKRCRNKASGLHEPCIHHGTRCRQRKKLEIVKSEEDNCQYTEMMIEDGCECYPDYGM